jgi:transposase InsO family protein
MSWPICYPDAALSREQSQSWTQTHSRQWRRPLTQPWFYLHLQNSPSNPLRLRKAQTTLLSQMRSAGETCSVSFTTPCLAIVGCSVLLKRCWPGVFRDVKHFISHCAECQKLRLLQPTFTPSPRSTFNTEPFRGVSMDTLGPFEPDGRGFTDIIAFVDAFTRWIELVPVSETSAVETAAALLQIVGRFGVPKFLRSDNAPDYTSKVISELLTLLGTERKLCLPYHPQANGLVERSHRETLRHLRALASSVTNFGKKWSTFLPLTQRIINASWHSAIGTSPARLLFAGRLNLDKGILPNSPTQPNGGEEEGTISLTPQEASDFVLELAKAQDALLRQSDDFQNDYFASRNGAPPSAPTSYELGDLQPIFKIRNGLERTVHGRRSTGRHLHRQGPCLGPDSEASPGTSQALQVGSRRRRCSHQCSLQQSLPR